MTARQILNLQERFLDSLLLEKSPVSIYLINGVKLQGTIEGYDQSIILLKNSLSQIIFKHNICSILPVEEIKRFSYNLGVHSTEEEEFTPPPDEESVTS